MCAFLLFIVGDFTLYKGVGKALEMNRDNGPLYFEHCIIISKHSSSPTPQSLT